MKKVLLILLLSTMFLSCGKNESVPKLVVFISVDQLSEDMFSHYHDLYQGGYRWMLDNGSWFTNVHHEHWYTTTGPGHFVLGSGQHPVKGGVIGNYYYHRGLDKVVYCVDDTLAHEVGNDKKSYSYRQITSSAIGDWLKAKYPKAKVYSVSGKDRAAVLLAGKNPDLAIWYDWRGKFVSSDYYTEDYPKWLTEYNENSNLANYRDSVWVRELDEDIYNNYTRPDLFNGEIDVFDTDEYSPVFPIGFDANLTDEQIVDKLGDGPWLDFETLKLANVILTEEKLGTDDTPDILFIGLSGSDVVGHNQGPFSHEAMDNQLKIDKYLDQFIQKVSRQVNLDDVLFVLTSDHGTIPLPEYLVQYKGIDSGRINRDSLRIAYDNINEEITNRFGEHVFVRDGRDFYYDFEVINERNIDKSELDKIVRRIFASIEGIGLILTKDEIQNADPYDKMMQRFINFTDPNLSPDIIAIPKEYWTSRYPLGATHGTPYSYDSNVPFIISWKDKLYHDINTEPQATVNIAPTVAKILGVEPLNEIDGKPIF